MTKKLPKKTPKQLVHPVSSLVACLVSRCQIPQHQLLLHCCTKDCQCSLLSSSIVSILSKSSRASSPATMALPRLGAINALRSTRLPIAAARRSGPAIRNHSSTSATGGPLASAAYTDAIATSPSSEATSSTPNLPPQHRSTLSSLLRVDHSGEIAANTIYAAQSQVFQHIRRDPASTELTLEMWENEKKHLKVAEMLLDQHRVRPSALNGLWGVMGSALGATTALMGREAAMACTEAVETVIGEHYDE